MSSEVQANILALTGALRVVRSTSTAIPASGVLQVSITNGPAITINDSGATTLVGIEYIDSNGGAVSIDQDAADVKFIRVAPGSAVTVAHDRSVDLDANALPAEQRIVTTSGKDFPLEVINAQAFYAYIASYGGFRWYFTDRPNFDSAIPADWNPNPDTVFAALDQLGNRSALRASGSATLASGVPQIVWSRTLAEGEVIGGSVRVTTQAESGGTTFRSFIDVTLTASRDVGGSAAVTEVGATESGTLSGGSVTLSSSGNDVRVQLTATYDGDVSWVSSVDLASISP